MKEAEIKTCLVDYLIKKHGSKISALAHEFRFSDGKRRADLICITEHLEAYEIKSNYDSLSKLHGQVKDYSKSFESLTIVTTHKHLGGVKKICPKTVGILLIENDNFFEYREATIRKRLNKLSILQMLTSITIIKELRKRKKSNLNSIQKNREKLSTLLTQEQILTLAKTTLISNLENSYSQFLREIGDITTIDDLKSLNMLSRELIVLN